MFFILSKILQFILTPVFWFLVLFVIIIYIKKPAIKKRITIISFILFYLLSNSFLLDEILRSWEYEAFPMGSLQRNYKIGIVMGGIGEIDEKNNFFNFHKSSDRLWHALELYQQGYIDKILLSGGSASILHPDMSEAIYLKDFLVRLHVPEEDIIVESKSRNTRENAVYTGQILNKYYPYSDYILITSAFHMKRSLGCFKKLGIKTDYYVTDRYAGPRKFEFDHLFLPNIDALFIWTFLIHEISGYIVYDIVGYI